MKFSALATIALATALGGCATLGPAQVEDAVAPFMVLDEKPGGGPVAAAVIFSPAAASFTFDVIDGDGKDQQITFRRESTTRYRAAWTEIEDDVREEFFQINEEGDVLLTAAIDHEESAVSLFNPPLTAVYATLVPGQPQVQEVEIRVVDLNDPRRQRESGKARQAIEHLGRRHVRTAKGEFVADCISIEFDARMRLARAQRHSVLYVIEGFGVIAATHEEKITALGLFNRSTRQTLLRHDLDDALRAAD